MPRSSTPPCSAAPRWRSTKILGAADVVSPRLDRTTALERDVDGALRRGREVQPADFECAVWRKAQARVRLTGRPWLEARKSIDRITRIGRGRGTARRLPSCPVRCTIASAAVRHIWDMGKGRAHRARRRRAKQARCGGLSEGLLQDCLSWRAKRPWRICYFGGPSTESGRVARNEQLSAADGFGAPFGRFAERSTARGRIHAAWAAYTKSASMSKP